MVKRASKPKSKAKSTKAVTTTGRSDQVRSDILAAKSDIEGGYVKLAALLTEAKDKEYYQDWGFSEFKDYAQEELDVHWRKAESLILIYKKAIEFKLDRKRIEKIGWSKTKAVVNSMTDENKDELLSLAEQSTAQELESKMKTIRIDNGSARASRERISRTKFEISMTEEEASVVLNAISESKRIIGNDNTVVALENICLEWMQSVDAQSPPTLESLIYYVKQLYAVELVVKDGGEAAFQAPIDVKLIKTAEPEPKDQEVVVTEEEIAGLKTKKAATQFIEMHNLEVAIGKKDTLDEIKGKIREALSDGEADWETELEAVDSVEGLQNFIDEYAVEGFEVESDTDVDVQKEALKALIDAQMIDEGGEALAEQDEVNALLGL